jgi:hypothetical protein
MCEKRVTGKQPSCRHNACGISYLYDKICHFAALISLHRYGHTLLWKIGNQKSAPFFNVLFY